MKTYCLALLAFVSLVADEKTYYSQFSQDQFVYERCFKDKYNGTFVDIGANDGIKGSNTYFFEKNLNWTGMCVEPLPEAFQQLKANRTCLCVEGCIYDKSETASFLKLSGYTELLSGILDNYNPQHLQRIQRELNYWGGSSEIITVKCFNLTKLLLDNGLTHIDYLSIDTEGGELGILQSIDFDKIAIEVIDVENNYNEPFQQFLAPLGYKKIAQLGIDEIYRKIY